MIILAFICALLYTSYQEVKGLSNIKYTSIMTDIVDSRKYDKINEIQEYMKYIISYSNTMVYKSLKKPFMFSNEKQELFVSLLSAYVLCEISIISDQISDSSFIR